MDWHGCLSQLERSISRVSLSIASNIGMWAIPCHDVDDHYDLDPSLLKVRGAADGQKQN